MCDWICKIRPRTQITSVSRLQPENRAAWSRSAPWLWNDVAEGRGPGRSSDICVRWQLPTSIAASAPAATTQMQIYCYSIIQFVAAYFARTLIPYNAAVVSITALLPETLKLYPTPVLSRDHVCEENNLLLWNIYLWWFSLSFSFACCAWLNLS